MMNGYTYVQKSHRILIVDDEDKVLFILSAALRTMGTGIEVATAQSGREALTKIVQDRFDLTITDIQMPDVNGIELTEEIRSREPGMPVVWVTAYGTRHVREESSRLGVYECLEKPLKIGEIRRVAREALEAAND